MPRFLDTTEEVQMTTSVARWLMDVTVGLLKHYLGRNYNPELGTFSQRELDSPCLEDRIPVEDFELRYWFNTVINLCTTIAGILHNSITRGEMLRMSNMSPLSDSPDESQEI